MIVKDYLRGHGVCLDSRRYGASPDHDGTLVWQDERGEQRTVRSGAGLHWWLYCAQHGMLQHRCGGFADYSWGGRTKYMECRLPAVCFQRCMPILTEFPCRIPKLFFQLLTHNTETIRCSDSISINDQCLLLYSFLEESKEMFPSHPPLHRRELEKKERKEVPSTAIESFRD